MSSVLAGIYVAGVVVGLLVMRDPLRLRLATALVWPLGPIAFVVVLAILLITSAALWPVTVLGTAAAIAALAWLVS